MTPVPVRVVLHHPEQRRYAWRDLELESAEQTPWQLSAALGLEADVLHDGALMFGATTPLIRLEARSDALPGGWTWTNQPPLALPTPRPWQRPGFFAGAWARLRAHSAVLHSAVLHSAGLHSAAAPARLISTSDLGAVLSVGEGDRQVFLKVGSGREAAVTAALWATQPALLPTVLRTDLERGELITRFGGDTLEKVGDLRAWTGAVRALARYHRSTGVPDAALHRFEDLPERGEALIRNGEVLLGWGLNESEISELAGALPELRRRHRLVSALGVPDSPVHGDSHGMNALWAAKRPHGEEWRPHGRPFTTKRCSGQDDGAQARWFDWSEAGQAHPFTDIGWLFFHSADRTWPISKTVPDLRARLADVYLESLGIPGAHTELESAEPLALWHRAVVYDANFRAWPEPRPMYVRFYLKWLLKSLKPHSDQVHSPT